MLLHRYFSVCLLVLLVLSIQGNYTLNQSRLKLLTDVASQRFSDSTHPLLLNSLT